MSAALEIKTDLNKRSFVPGDRIKGTVSWLCDSPPSTAELRLSYYTSGKGSEDIEIESTTLLEHPMARQERSFDLHLPPGPSSFSGKLISLHWALELVVVVVDHAATERFEFVLSPTGSELDLYAYADGNIEEGIKKRNLFQIERTF